MGGQAIIGITLFLILLIINFVVITKGSGRIAEVSARFIACIAASARREESDQSPAPPEPFDEVCPSMLILT